MKRVMPREGLRPGRGVNVEEPDHDAAASTRSSGNVNQFVTSPSDRSRRDRHPFQCFMRIDDLADALNQKPFEPLRLHLTDGSVVDVATPYLSFIQPGGSLYVARGKRTEAGAAENVELIPAGDISDVRRTW